MATSFSSLRSSRKSLLDKLASQAKTEAQKGGGVDERFWKLTIDQKTKLGSAVIRFLPPPKNEELAWVRVFQHAFKGPGGTWFIENCPTTLGQDCPVCKRNNELWNTGIEDKKNIARDRKRKLQFISNVLVISDPAKPENNGKVFLFKYGAKIHDKLKEAMEPEFPEQEALNPFDLWEGADFRLRSRDQAGFVNYDKSEFAPVAAVQGDDEALEKLWESEHSLQQFVAADQFKPFADIEKRLESVLNGTSAPKTAEEAIKNEQANDEDAADIAERAKAEAKKERVKKIQPPKPAKPAPAPEPAAEPEDEDIKNFFGSLGDDE